MENTSGQGRHATIPNEVRGWNWGAFLLHWIWGLGNSAPIALLMFVPLVNLVMPFVLGIKGSEWAWRNQKWESVAAFKQEQRVWGWVGAGLYIGGISFVAAFLFFIGGIMKGTDAYQISFDQIIHNPQVIGAIGEPIEPGFFVSGKVNIQGQTGYADISYSLTGPKAEATAYVRAEKEMGQWLFQRIIVEIEPDKRRIVLVEE